MLLTIAKLRSRCFHAIAHTSESVGYDPVDSDRLSLASGKREIDLARCKHGIVGNVE